MLKNILLLAGLTTAYTAPTLISSGYMQDPLEGLVSTSLTSNTDMQDELKNLCDPTVESAAGFYNIDTKTSKKYFYWFFESRSDPANDPVVLWLTGGPGCSSELALLVENGPCKITKGETKPTRNEYSWNTKANLLYVDQPAGTGFSEANLDGYDVNEEGVSRDLYHFIIEFLKANPQFADNDFFITGESYAGHYVPATAHRVWLGNKNKESDIYIPLAGIAIGNGLTDPEIQYKYYPEMVYTYAKEVLGKPILPKVAYEAMNAAMPACTAMIRKCQTNELFCFLAKTYCTYVANVPYAATGKNVYNIRAPCEVKGLCYDFSAVDKFLNDESTQAALGVKKPWASCNYGVNMAFSNDWMKNYQDQIPELLEDGIRVLIYAGDLDFICNWLGNKAWTTAMEWSGLDEFQVAEDKAWMMNDTQAGEKRTHNHFTFLRVFEAGHMVPMDQPEAALHMLNEFISNTEEF
jgi:cathepsin A (carboxypeptidase C)